jgi:hypothetical protein
MVRRLLLSLLLCLGATAAPRPHPRLQIDDKLLSQIRALRDRQDPLWLRLEKFTASSRPNGQAPAVVFSNMLLYLVSDDSAAFDRAWQFVSGKIYRNKTDRSDGLTPLIDIYKDKHQAAFIGGDFIGVIAHFYDWGYAKLTSDQRKDLAQWLLDACSFTWLENQSSHAFLRNDGASAAFGLSSTAFALQGRHA